MAALKIENDGKCKHSSFSASIDLEVYEKGWCTLNAGASGDCESEVKEELVHTLTGMRDQLNALIATVQAELAARTPEAIEQEQAEAKRTLRQRYGGGRG